MSASQYEVVYIDKFTDMVEAAIVKDNLQKTFGLKPDHLQKLASGKPVVIKKQVNFDEANRYKAAVDSAGGVAWVQELGPDGEHVERRQSGRRQLKDRRAVFRASAILPDRRQNCGRRSTDRSTYH